MLHFALCYIKEVDKNRAMLCAQYYAALWPFDCFFFIFFNKNAITVH